MNKEEKQLRASMPVDLGDNLVMRFAKQGDAPALIDLAFHVLDEGEQDYPAIKTFMEDFFDGKVPYYSYDDFTVVEETDTGKIVSSMCTFSETWRYSGAPFQVGRPVLVMTAESHRRRGLVRQQFDVIHKLSAARGDVMCCITGISSFYRQFGYEMALNLGGGYRIVEPMFPPLKPGTEDDYVIRYPDSQEDRRFIRHLHETTFQEWP